MARERTEKYSLTVVIKGKFSFTAKYHDKQLRTSHSILFPARRVVIYFIFYLF